MIVIESSTEQRERECELSCLLLYYAEFSSIPTAKGANFGLNSLLRRRPSLLSPLDWPLLGVANFSRRIRAAGSHLFALLCSQAAPAKQTHGRQSERARPNERPVGNALTSGEEKKQFNFSSLQRTPHQSSPKVSRKWNQSAARRRLISRCRRLWAACEAQMAPLNPNWTGRLDGQTKTRFLLSLAAAAAAARRLGCTKAAAAAEWTRNRRCHTGDKIDRGPEIVANFGSNTRGQIRIRFRIRRPKRAPKQSQSQRDGCTTPAQRRGRGSRGRRRHCFASCSARAASLGSSVCERGPQPEQVGAGWRRTADGGRGREARAANVMAGRVRAGNERAPASSNACPLASLAAAQFANFAPCLLNAGSSQQQQLRRRRPSARFRFATAPVRVPNRT